MRPAPSGYVTVTEGSHGRNGSKADSRCLPRKPPRRLDPFLDQRLVLLGPFLREAFGGEPGAMHALGAEMVLGDEARRIVEARDGQVHVPAAFLELEAERGPALAAIGPPRDRGAFEPVGRVLPLNLGLL